MGSSLPSVISPIMKHLMFNRYTRVLDIGIGEAGLWGFLMRDKFDSTMQQRHFCDTDSWKLVITGIEVCEKYKNPVIDYLYDKVYWCDAFEALESASDRYDLVFLTSVIEHFEKERGFELLMLIRERMANRGTLVLTSPNGYQAQPPTDGNPWDEHKSGWGLDDIDRIKGLGYLVQHSEITYDDRVIIILKRQ